jgi:hypothetical protein
MTASQLKSIKELPKDLHPLLQAMWYDYQDDWEASHHLAQDVNTRDGSWVHAYLHRKEGDPSNASYWYRQAGKQMPAMTLENEWEEIVTALLEK